MLSVDIAAALGKTISPSFGIPDSDLTALDTPMKRYIGDWLKERRDGAHAWSMDPYNRRMVERVRQVAAQAKKQRIQTVVWIGIGGSSLGPQVVQEAFEGRNSIEFLIVDTIDPTQLELYLDVLDWKHTMVVVVSKSGTTLETMSAFFLFWDQLKKTRGVTPSERVIGITDAKKGPLYSFCTQHGIEMLPIPRDVGGRYCIFSPVGLLPMALLGADLDEFMRGAKEMDTLCQNTSRQENPAALLAAAQFLLETKKGYLIRVIMPYIQRLASLARWDQQLIAESLGKDEVHNPFPFAAVGTQDQHSMLQQWMAGPRKAWLLFIRETEKPRLFVPKDIDSTFHYMAGKSFGQLLDACSDGTARALTAAKRPHVTITVTRLDAYHLGQLFFCFMTEVVLLGKLYRIDPYGQPAVETGKQITKDILSRGQTDEG